MEFQYQQPQQQTEEKPTLFYKLKRFVRECIRVLKVTKKPTSMEFKTIVKVSGIGIIIIGMLGFVIQMIEQLVR
jgi:protein transport protein SEC61 subunit gamma-like protein